MILFFVVVVFFVCFFFCLFLLFFFALKHRSRVQISYQRIMRKPTFAYAKTKTQISFAVTLKLISAFVFDTWIVQIPLLSKSEILSL